METESFDVIIAFEVLEHVDCIKECHDLLKSGGTMLATSPMPSRDWIFRALELVGLSQKRTSPHSNLLWFKKVPYFELVAYQTVGFLSQWARFRKV